MAAKKSTITKRPRGAQFKPPLYVLPHGIQVIGEYAPTKINPYWRVRIRPHRFFNTKIISNGQHLRKNRVLLAAKLGRAIARHEHAHHKDENRENDSMRNIERLTAAEHNRHHHIGLRHTKKIRAQISASLKRCYAEGRRSVTMDQCRLARWP